MQKYRQVEKRLRDELVWLYASAENIKGKCDISKSVEGLSAAFNKLNQWHAEFIQTQRRCDPGRPQDHMISLADLISDWLTWLEKLEFSARSYYSVSGEEESGHDESSGVSRKKPVGAPLEQLKERRRRREGVSGVTVSKEVCGIAATP